MNTENIRIAREAADCHVIGNLISFGKLLQCLHISLCQGMIDNNFGRNGIDRFNTDINVHLSPGNSPLKVAFDLFLQKTISPGNTGTKFIISVIHRLDFHRNIHTGQGSLMPAVTRHTSNHDFQPDFYTLYFFICK